MPEVSRWKPYLDRSCAEAGWTVAVIDSRPFGGYPLTPPSVSPAAMKRRTAKNRTIGGSA
jgi:hypothetical protein